MLSVKWGEMLVTRGFHINVVEMRGHTPPSCRQMRGYLRPLLRQCAVGPNNVSEKKVCVLGMGGGHLASASKLSLRHVEARGSASRGRVLPISPFGLKIRGYTPLLTIFLKNSFLMFRAKFESTFS